MPISKISFPAFIKPLEKKFKQLSTEKKVGVILLASVATIWTGFEVNGSFRNLYRYFKACSIDLEQEAIKHQIYANRKTEYSSAVPPYSSRFAPLSTFIFKMNQDRANKANKRNIDDFPNQGVTKRPAAAPKSLRIRKLIGKAKDALKEVDDKALEELSMALKPRIVDDFKAITKGLSKDSLKKLFAYRLAVKEIVKERVGEKKLPKKFVDIENIFYGEFGGLFLKANQKILRDFNGFLQDCDINEDHDIFKAKDAAAFNKLLEKKVQEALKPFVKAELRDDNAFKAHHHSQALTKLYKPNANLGAFTQQTFDGGGPLKYDDINSIFQFFFSLPLFNALPLEIGHFSFLKSDGLSFDKVCLFNILHNKDLSPLMLGKSQVKLDVIDYLLGKDLPELFCSTSNYALMFAEGHWIEFMTTEDDSSSEKGRKGNDQVMAISSKIEQYTAKHKKNIEQDLKFFLDNPSNEKKSARVLQHVKFAINLKRMLPELFSKLTSASDSWPHLKAFTEKYSSLLASPLTATQVLDTLQSFTFLKKQKEDKKLSPENELAMIAWYRIKEYQNISYTTLFEETVSDDDSIEEVTLPEKTVSDFDLDIKEVYQLLNKGHIWEISEDPPTSPSFGGLTILDVYLKLSNAVAQRKLTKDDVLDFEQLCQELSQTDPRIKQLLPIDLEYQQLSSLLKEILNFRPTILQIAFSRDETAFYGLVDFDNIGGDETTEEQLTKRTQDAFKTFTEQQVKELASKLFKVTQGLKNGDLESCKEIPNPYASKSSTNLVQEYKNKTLLGFTAIEKRVEEIKASPIDDEDSFKSAVSSAEQTSWLFKKFYNALTLSDKRNLLGTPFSQNLRDKKNIIDWLRNGCSRGKYTPLVLYPWGFRALSYGVEAANYEKVIKSLDAIDRETSSEAARSRVIEAEKTSNPDFLEFVKSLETRGESIDQFFKTSVQTVSKESSSPTDRIKELKVLVDALSEVPNFCKGKDGEEFLQFCINLEPRLQGFADELALIFEKKDNLDAITNPVLKEIAKKLLSPSAENTSEDPILPTWFLDASW